MKIWLLVFGVALVALAGCGSSDNGSATAPATTSAAAPSDPKAQALLRAADTATKQFPDSRLGEIEQRNDDGTWEVILVTPDGAYHRLALSSDGRTVVETESLPPEDEAERAERISYTQDAQVDYQGALDTLLAELPAGTALDGIIELRLEETEQNLVDDVAGGEPAPTTWPTASGVTNGHPVWFATGGGQELVIDALSGNVLTRE